eukprot:TRINITY_DN18121_c0_g1_i3.p1 TRINITY_DN18121_c0_g1~~TRINITY_DN18121_c0_g1_i3.p1  ORF type:complete len:155 (-),score=13.80 TRINITY_DN18121_c0_g1_i3:120-584(-)
MPNRWGRIDMDGIQAMSHACQHELQLTTAFGSNMFRNAGLIRPKSEPSIVEIPAATLNATLKKAQRKAEEKHAATRSMSSQKNASASRASTSKSQTFMARHRQRLDDKADAMREEMSRLTSLTGIFKQAAVLASIAHCFLAFTTHAQFFALIVS